MMASLYSADDGFSYIMIDCPHETKQRYVTISFSAYHAKNAKEWHTIILKFYINIVP